MDEIKRPQRALLLEGIASLQPSRPDRLAVLLAGAAVVEAIDAHEQAERVRHEELLAALEECS